MNHWDPDKYKANANMQFITSARLIDWYLPPVANSDKVKKILDIGCGVGNVTRYLLDRFPQADCLGIDVNSKMVTAANTSYRQENLQFLAKDVLQLDDQGSYDLIVSFWCLHWLAGKAQILDAIQRVHDALVANGFAFLMLPLKHPALYNAIESVIGYQDFVKFERYFASELEMSELLKSEGIVGSSWQDIVMEKKISWHFATEKEVLGFVDTVLPALTVSSAKRVELVAAVADQYMYHMEKDFGDLQTYFHSLLIAFNKGGK